MEKTKKYCVLCEKELPPNREKNTCEECLKKTGKETEKTLEILTDRPWEQQREEV